MISGCEPVEAGPARKTVRKLKTCRVERLKMASSDCETAPQRALQADAQRRLKRD